MSEYLITGGAGFIGSHLVEKLLSMGKTVRVLDNLATGKMENIKPFLDKIDFIQGDLRDLKTCQQACAGVRYVSHQGALGSVPRSVEDPLTTNDVNITGTLHMLVAARDAGVKKFVFASSSSLYGNTAVLPKVETMSPTPLSPYALSKLTAEYYVGLFFKLYGLETVSLRYFNVFGPRQDETSQYAAVIPKFAKALIAGQKPTIFGDGGQTRDFTFIGDTVHANLLAFDSPTDAAGKFYNIAYNKRISLVDLLAELKKIIAQKIPGAASIEPEFTATRKGDVRDSQADYSLATRFLGFDPQYNLVDGLKITADYYLASLTKSSV